MNITITPPDKLLKLALDIRNNDGKLYIVGGSVRDVILGYKPKDWDAEIHGIPIDKLIGILHNYNATDQVGRAKGVWKIFDTSTTPRIEYDISLPLQKMENCSKIWILHYGLEISQLMLWHMTHWMKNSLILPEVVRILR